MSPTTPPESMTSYAGLLRPDDMGRPLVGSFVVGSFVEGSFVEGPFLEGPFRAAG